MARLIVTLEGQELLRRPLDAGEDGVEVVCRLDGHLDLFDRDEVRRLTGVDDFWEAAEAFLTDPALFPETPCALFDPGHYGRQGAPFPSLHPLLHYILVGDAAGLEPHPFVAAAWIRKRYAVPEDTTALGFLLKNSSSVAPNPYFDPVYYLTINRDIFQSGISPLRHYLDYGIEENRNFHALFNVGYYQATAGREEGSLENFLEHRLLDGIFPHPKARAGWAFLPAGDLAELFEYHLAKTAHDRQVTPPNPRLELMPDLFEDEQRSIQEAFPHHRAQILEHALLDHYHAHEGLSRILVSVVVPTRNRLPTLRAAVASIARQGHRALEILIVDDGSTDGTEAWIESLDDPRIRYVRRPPRGVSAARNHALDLARGKYVTFLDSDNAHAPNFIAAMLAFCERGGVALAYGALRLYNKKGDIRFRFRPYDEADYWKTNYIDLNVLFHAREAFGQVRFDETLRRCVDWDYILKASAVVAPVGVPIIGCDYSHESGDLDRITLNGPVWDCFRVFRAHRPAPLRRGRVANVIVLPVTAASARPHVRLLSRDLEGLPEGWLVQAACNLEVPAEARLAIRALLVSKGHPEPLLSTSPLCGGALAEFGAGACPFAADRWHFVDPSREAALGDLVSLATARSGGPAVAAGAVTAVTVADEAGFVEAMRYDHDSLGWAYAEVDRDGLGPDCLPLRTTLLNVPGFAAEAMELRFSGSLTMALLLRDLWRLSEVRLVVTRTPVIAALDRAEITAGLDLLNAAGAPAPSLRVPPGTGIRDAIAATAYHLDGARLAPVHRRRRLAGRKALAVFTPAPHAGSGWGDEHYARSLAAAMRARRIDCDVVYRGEWSERRDAYEAIVHLRGIVPVQPSWTAHNFLWVISHPEAVGDEEYAGCDSLAAASRPFAESLGKVLARPVHYLPQCTAFSPPEAPAAGVGAALDGYALFVGDSKLVNRPPINELIAGWDRLFLIGPRWGDLPAMGPRYLPQTVENHLLPGLYAAFGAVLNQHWESMARHGFVSNRIYDVIASGGQVVTDPCAGIPPDILERIVVWRGGPMEEAFLRARSLRGADTVDSARAFAAANSFSERARSLLAFWGEDVGDLRL